MNDRDQTDVVLRWLDDELSDEEARRLEAARAEDPELAAELEGARSVLAAFRAEPLDETPRTGLLTAALEEAARRPPPLGVRLRGWLGTRGFGLALASACALLLFVAVDPRAPEAPTRDGPAMFQPPPDPAPAGGPMAEAEPERGAPEAPGVSRSPSGREEIALARSAEAPGARAPEGSSDPVVEAKNAEPRRAKRGVRRARRRPAPEAGRPRAARGAPAAPRARAVAPEALAVAPKVEGRTRDGEFAAPVAKASADAPGTEGPTRDQESPAPVARVDAPRVEGRTREDESPVAKARAVAPETLAVAPEADAAAPPAGAAGLGGKAAASTPAAASTRAAASTPVAPSTEPAPRAAEAPARIARSEEMAERTSSRAAGSLDPEEARRAARALLRRAARARSGGELARARRILDEAEKRVVKDPMRGRVLLAKAELELAAGRPRIALSLAERASEVRGFGAVDRARALAAQARSQLGGPPE